MHLQPSDEVRSALIASGALTAWWRSDCCDLRVYC